MPGKTGRPATPIQPPARLRVETPEDSRLSSPSPIDIGTTSLLERTKLEILVVTYWFEPIPAPAEPYPVTVRFTGRRVDVQGKLGAADQFTQDEIVDRVIPGSGPISVTAKVRNIQPGSWEVNARIVGPSQPGRSTHRSHHRASRSSQLSAQQGIPLSMETPDRIDTWFWRRWAPSVEWSSRVKTGLEPFARIPGSLPLIWAAFVGLGMAVALIVQSLILTHLGLRLGPVWAWTLLAIGFGVAGAKIWFIVKHRSERRFEGWCIQGFIAGAAPAALLLFIRLHLPIGTVFDASAPGLMLGMAVGRVGCFLGGCCVGLPTSSWWGVWCGDQHIGARRIPTQLMESVSALLLGCVLLLALLTHGPAGGFFFVGALAAYTLLREGLLRLRAEPLKIRGPAISIGAALVLAAAIFGVVIY
jgi:phosphatidylglycerol---prolipoprotein diacylglyceryl transferase